MDGQTYYISVDVQGAANNGSFTLELYDYDYYEGAKEMTMNTTSADEAYSTVGASPDQSKGSCWAAGPIQNRWFKFVANETGNAVARVDVGGVKGTQQWTNLAVWNSSLSEQKACAIATTADEDVEGSLSDLVYGQTYYISVDVQDAANDGSFTLELYDNDFYQGAQHITALIGDCSADAEFTTIGATAVGSTPDHCYPDGATSNR